MATEWLRGARVTNSCLARPAFCLIAALVVTLASAAAGPRPPQPPAGSAAGPVRGQNPISKFETGIELINVTATVSDASGRFVPNLRKDDFQVFEDDLPQTITYFSAERVPVSLGIALDTSGSMAGDKLKAAEAALDQFLSDLLDRQDEVFLYAFSDRPRLVQGWTQERASVLQQLGRVAAGGGTAMYDTVAEAVPMAATGQHPKKALVVISDGNDTASERKLAAVKQIIHESDVLVYAIGIDGSENRITAPAPAPIPLPPPRGPVFPPGWGGWGGWPRRPPPTGGGGWKNSHIEDPANVQALRDLTDDSGGRTEIIRRARDLNPATAGIADELSRQYFLAYPSSGRKDGRWHAIRVEVGNRSYRVRARRGYVAS